MNKSEFIKDLVKNLAPFVNGNYDETAEGVPRIIVQGKDYKLSIIFVANSHQWKVFFPFPAEEQTKLYFDNTDLLKDFLKSQGVENVT